MVRREAGRWTRREAGSRVGVHERARQRALDVPGDDGGQAHVHGGRLLAAVEARQAARVPEAVADAEGVHLAADQLGEDGADRAALDVRLQEAADEEVHVVGGRVEAGEGGARLRLERQAGEGAAAAVQAQLPAHREVGGQAVVAAALHVQREEVQAGAAARVEQEAPQVLHQVDVHLLRHRRRHAGQHRLEAVPRQVLRHEEGVAQRHLAAAGRAAPAHLQPAAHLAVAEAERRRRELVVHLRPHRRVVGRAVGHAGRAHQERQVLGHRHVLHLGDHEAPRQLERLRRAQLRPRGHQEVVHQVVLAHQQRVQRQEARLLVAPVVARRVEVARAPARRVVLGRARHRLARQEAPVRRRRHPAAAAAALAQQAAPALVRPVDIGGVDERRVVVHLLPRTARLAAAARRVRRAREAQQLRARRLQVEHQVARRHRDRQLVLQRHRGAQRVRQRQIVRQELAPVREHRRQPGAARLVACLLRQRVADRPRARPALLRRLRHAVLVRRLEHAQQRAGRAPRRVLRVVAAPVDRVELGRDVRRVRQDRRRPAVHQCRERYHISARVRKTSCSSFLLWLSIVCSGLWSVFRHR
mmetsp:Transcript_10770/g.44147  ORF Transcript_10770/g.44147 Transcript_10770/m.44147 type:complete len:587 (+) Transcript_10770:191-1951(+)